MVIAKTTGYEVNVKSEKTYSYSNSKKDESGSTEDFMSIMSMSMTNIRVENKNDLPKQTNNDVSNENYKRDDDTSSINDLSKSDSTTSDVKDKNSSNEDTTVDSKDSVDNQKNDSEKLDDVSKTDKTLGDEDVAEDDLAADDMNPYDLIASLLINNNSDVDVKDFIKNLSDAISDIKDIMMKALGVDENTLNSMLSDANVDDLKLFNKDTFKDLLLQFNDSESLDMLTNENLANMINSAIDDLDEILSTIDIPIEEIENQLGNLEFSDVKILDENEEPVGEDIVLNIDQSTKLENENKEVSNKTVGKTDNDNSNNLSNQDVSKQDILDTVINKLDSAINEVKTENSIFANDEIEASIVRQVIDEIKLIVKNDFKSMELQLYPEHLGKLQIQVAEKNGVLTASIVTENEAAKQAIENSLTVLKDAFNSQEIKVDAVEVSVATTGFEQSNEGKNDGQEDNKTKGHRKINLANLNEDNLDEDEEMQISLMKSEGRTVDYTA